MLLVYCRDTAFSCPDYYLCRPYTQLYFQFIVTSMHTCRGNFSSPGNGD